MFYLYILKNTDDKIYIGHTNNLERRIQYHKNGNGAKFVKAFGEFNLVYDEEFERRSDAMKREKQLKGWTRAKKEALISGNTNLLKKL